jgi:hypothetical protein
MIDNKPEQAEQKHSKILGSLKINYVISFYLTIILITPAYTYYMAVSKKEEPPFPHVTVTNTACHYPQAIIFRWAMTSAAGFLTLMFHVVFRFYEKEAQRYQYPGNTYAYMYWPSVISVGGYMAAISTIDTGGTNTMHSVGAVYFFICLFFLVVNLTIISRKMRNWDVRFMEKRSLIIKMIVALYLSIIWVYCLIGLIIYGNDSEHPNDEDIYIVIVEWNLVYAGLIWILCFFSDMKSVSLVLSKNEERNDNMVARDANIDSAICC